MEGKSKLVRCNKCMRVFAGAAELELFVDIQTAADDVRTLRYQPEEDYGFNYVVYGACPDCETDAYLTDVEGQDDD